MVADSLTLEERMQDKCAAWACGVAPEEATRKRKRKSASSTAQPKMYRQKAYRWLLELDNSLQLPNREGPGLKHFQLPPDWLQDPDPLKWPCLVISSDQGSDAWAAMNWMDSSLGRINFVREPDSHTQTLAKEKAQGRLAQDQAPNPMGY